MEILNGKASTRNIQEQILSTKDKTIVYSFSFIVESQILFISACEIHEKNNQTIKKKPQL